MYIDEKIGKNVFSYNTESKELMINNHEEDGGIIMNKPDIEAMIEYLRFICDSGKL